MKSAPFVILSIVSILFLFTSCHKEEITSTPVLETTSEAQPEIQALRAGLSNVSNHSGDTPIDVFYENLTLGVSEYPCTGSSGTTLFVYFVLADDLLQGINLETYNIEWYNKDYQILGREDTVSCIPGGKTYWVMVWHKITNEAATYQITPK